MLSSRIVDINIMFLIGPSSSSFRPNDENWLLLIYIMDLAIDGALRTPNLLVYVHAQYQKERNCSAVVLPLILRSGLCSVLR